MQILGGFIGVLGISAIAISLAIFSFGLAPVIGASILGGAGIVTALIGMGLFKHDSLPEYEDEQVLSESAPLMS